MAKKKIALLIVALLAVDQIVKIWIKTHFALDESVTVFPNWFFIRFIENPGARRQLWQTDSQHIPARSYRRARLLHPPFAS